nr:transposase, MuDR, MULE transposase domain protein [Tanacetum cinerariifolium]
MSSEGPDSTICSDIVFRDWVNSYSCDEIVLDIFYNGCFVIYPFNYGGDALELNISKVNKLSYKEMCDLLVEKVNEDIWHWFYCKPDCCLEEGLTIVENDRDVKIMYEMANLHGHLEVYVAHFPQYLVTDYYLKNLCVDETDDEVTKQLLSHQNIYKEVFGLSLEEMRAWEKRAIVTMLPNIS